MSVLHIDVTNESNRNISTARIAWQCKQNVNEDLCMNVSANVLTLDESLLIWFSSVLLVKPPSYSITIFWT